MSNVYAFETFLISSVTKGFASGETDYNQPSWNNSLQIKTYKIPLTVSREGLPLWLCSIVGGPTVAVAIFSFTQFCYLNANTYRSEIGIIGPNLLTPSVLVPIKRGTHKPKTS